MGILLYYRHKDEKDELVNKKKVEKLLTCFSTFS